MTHVSEEPTVFHPETLHILGSALDDAWQRLEVRVHFNGSGDAVRTILAKHIIAMAKQGERDRQRLIEGALARLKLEAVSVGGPRPALEGPLVTAPDSNPAAESPIRPINKS
jgi:hypothetical protein